MKNEHALLYGIACFSLALCGCEKRPSDAPSGEHAGAHAAESAPPTNRIDVPESVRRNLGITFAKVESRPVAQTIRVPGRFEYIPEARREYRTMLAGRVELSVKQYQRVEAEQRLYLLASPEWHELQEKISAAESEIRQAEARAKSIPVLLAAHHKHEESLRTSADLWEKRVEQLDQTKVAGVISSEEVTSARSTFATQKAQLAEVLEKEAELEAQRIETEAQLGAAKARFRLLISTAATLLNLDEEELTKACEPPHTGTASIRHHEGPSGEPAPFWRELHEIEVRATAPGIIQSLDLTNGAWVSTGSLVLATVDPTGLRFVASGMQSDLGRLQDGLPARIVPPKGGSLQLLETMDATLTVGLAADPEERTVELIAVPMRVAPWARVGVAAHLEVITAGGRDDLAIPLSSVIQDGLSKIFFRRDPSDPDKVIRTEADLGVNDGKWVVVQSGIREGDEVVLDGVYQLMLASSAVAQKGGHFHSDGTFHEGEDK